MIIIGFIVKQTWWHVEEIYFPSHARKIRQVMDIFTSQTEIPIEFGKDYEFVGLRVIARNCPNKEIGFLEKKDFVNSTTLILNLGSLDIFPVVSNRKGLKCRHIKIEIEYISTNPEITDANYLFNWDEIPGDDNGRLIEFLKRKSDNDWVETARIEKIDNKTINVFSENKSVYLRLNNNKTKVETDKYIELIVKQENGILNIYESKSLIEKIFDAIFPKKRSTIEIKGKIQPELYLTLPLGWRIRGPREKSELFKKVFGIDKEGYSVGMVCRKYESPVTSSDEPFEIIFNKPFISQNQGKRTYSYSIYADNFSKLNGYFKNCSSNSVSFEFTYFAKISTLIGIISLIPYVFFIISFFMLLNMTSSSTYDIIMPYFIIVLSFSYFYYSLIKDGYDIPRKYQHILIFMFSIATIFLIFLIEVISIQSFLNIISNVSLINTTNNLPFVNISENISLMNTTNNPKFPLN